MENNLVAPTRYLVLIGPGKSYVDKPKRKIKKEDNLKNICTSSDYVEQVCIVSKSSVKYSKKSCAHKVSVLIVIGQKKKKKKKKKQKKKKKKKKKKN